MANWYPYTLGGIMYDIRVGVVLQEFQIQVPGCTCVPIVSLSLCGHGRNVNLLEEKAKWSFMLKTEWKLIPNMTTTICCGEVLLNVLGILSKYAYWRSSYDFPYTFFHPQIICFGLEIVWGNGMAVHGRETVACEYGFNYITYKYFIVQFVDALCERLLL